MVLKSVDGTEASYKLTGNELYVRARITNFTAKPHGWDSPPSTPRLDTTSRMEKASGDQLGHFPITPRRMTEMGGKFMA